MTRKRLESRATKPTASQRALDKLMRETSKLLHPDVAPRFAPKWPMPRKRASAPARR